MSVERNKAVARCLFVVWGGKLGAIEELHAMDYVADYQPYARCGVAMMRSKEWYSMLMLHFPTTMKSCMRWLPSATRSSCGSPSSARSWGSGDFCRRPARRSASRRSSFCAPSTTGSPNNVAFPITSPRYAGSVSCRRHGKSDRDALSLRGAGAGSFEFEAASVVQTRCG